MSRPRPSDRPDLAPTPKRDARGRWYVRPYVGTDPATGQKVRPMHRLAATSYHEAAREAREWWAAQVGRERLGDYLARWLDLADLTPQVRRKCAGDVARVSRTSAADVEVRSMTPADLDGLAANLAGLDHAPATVRATLQTVGRALADLARAGITNGTPYLGASDHMGHARALAANGARPTPATVADHGVEECRAKRRAAGGTGRSKQELILKQSGEKGGRA